jgi:succinoglycan biosynthesis transport protein ExoP
VRDANQILMNFFPMLWRRWFLILAITLLTSGGAFLYANTAGERYEAYTLLRVGQGIRDRSANSVGGLGESADLSGRIDSLVRIATTNQVIGLAASRVGFNRLFKKQKDSKQEDSKLSKLLLGSLAALPPQLDFLKSLLEAKKPTDVQDSHLAAISSLRDLVSAKPEGRSDLLRISFRHPDPSVVSDFLNELSIALIATQADLVQVPGADVFFQQQTKRLELETEKAGADLRNFSVGASIYSVAEQRQLLLKRADDLGTQIANTRGAIEDRKGQKQAILDQLQILRPVYQSKTVTGIVGSLRGRDFKESENSVGTIPNTDGELPPLLLVKVYQDAMASLLKVNTDLNGSLRLEKQFVGELQKIRDELASLSSKEAEYDRLKRVLTRASAAADHYGSRVIEEQINLDIAKKTQLSSVRVIQSAERPIAPVFPRMIHLVLLGLIGGIAIGSAMALMLEYVKARRRDDEVSSMRSMRLVDSEIQAAE